MMARHKLDCTGLKCPMPIVKIAKEIKNIDTDDTLEVISTDAGFKLDVEAWCNRTGNQLMSFDELVDNNFVAVIVKK